MQDRPYRALPAGLMRFQWPRRKRTPAQVERTIVGRPSR
jgi:hypothetical protein